MCEPLTLVVYRTLQTSRRPVKLKELVARLPASNIQLSQALRNLRDRCLVRRTSQGWVLLPVGRSPRFPKTEAPSSPKPVKVKSMAVGLTESDVYWHYYWKQPRETRRLLEKPTHDG